MNHMICDVSVSGLASSVVCSDDLIRIGLSQHSTEQTESVLTFVCRHSTQNKDLSEEPNQSHLIGRHTFSLSAIG